MGNTKRVVRKLSENDVDNSVSLDDIGAVDKSVLFEDSGEGSSAGEVGAAEEGLREKELEYELEYGRALERLQSYGLEWTLRSIQYAIYEENVSFGQLRSCIYKQDGEAVWDYMRSTRLLIKAGLVGSNQIAESKKKELDERAWEIMEDWRSNELFIGTLHLLIIREMEEKHFFIGGKDLGILQHSVSKNLQKDLARNLLAADLEERIRQAQALTK